MKKAEDANIIARSYGPWPGLKASVHTWDGRPARPGASSGGGESVHFEQDVNA